jgi:ATP-dependent DNA ligase
MQPLRTGKKPFDQKVKDENATTWLIPKLVGEVKFTEWTSEGGRQETRVQISPRQLLAKIRQYLQ